MTDIELLPLPEPNGSYTNPYDGDDLENYARANVAHATAAKDTEIERLRAEREVIVAEAMKYAGKSGRLEAKVERLAEALRELEPFVQHHDSCGDHYAYNNSPFQTCGCGLDSLLERIAALRDHDQEVGNG